MPTELEEIRQLQRGGHAFERILSEPEPYSAGRIPCHGAGIESACVHLARGEVPLIVRRGRILVGGIEKVPRSSPIDAGGVAQEVRAHVADRDWLSARELGIPSLTVVAERSLHQRCPVEQLPAISQGGVRRAGLLLPQERSFIRAEVPQRAPARGGIAI